jgi:hypothetical protein
MDNKNRILEAREIAQSLLTIQAWEPKFGPQDSKKSDVVVCAYNSSMKEVEISGSRPSCHPAILLWGKLQGKWKTSSHTKKGRQYLRNNILGWFLNSIYTCLHTHRSTTCSPTQIYIHKHLHTYAHKHIYTITHKIKGNRFCPHIVSVLFVTSIFESYCTQFCI